MNSKIAFDELTKSDLESANSQDYVSGFEKGLNKKLVQ